MSRLLLSTFALFLLLSIPASAGWKWSFQDGFTEDPEVLVSWSPQTADELAAAGFFPAAARRYAFLAQTSTDDPDVRKLALLKCGDAWLRAELWADAFDAYELFAGLIETHADRLRVRRFQIEACILGVRDGSSWDWFGLTRGSRWAAKKGREILDAFAFEDWSAGARLRLADAMLEAGEFEDAVIEYEWLLTDFPDSPWTPTARFRKAEALLSEFEGVPYDLAPLLDARRDFQRYLDDYPNGDKVEEARARIFDVDLLRAERDWAAYRFYRQAGKWRSARFYLNEILKRHPETSWAMKAREALPEAEEECRALEEGGGR